MAENEHLALRARRRRIARAKKVPLNVKDLITIHAALEAFRDVKTYNPNQAGPRNRRVTEAQIKVSQQIEEMLCEIMTNV